MTRGQRDLRTLQQWMLAVIRQPEGVPVGIERNRELVPISPGELDSVLPPSRSLDSQSRLRIYAHAYFARLLECLADEFPAVKAAAGDDAFHALVLNYLEQHPSTKYSLEFLGEQFPEFLRRTRPAHLPPGSWADFLTELSRLERLYSDVFNGPGVESETLLSPEDLARLTPNDWMHARLIPVPCLRLARFDFPVHEYATAVRKRQESPKLPRAAATWLIVTRRDFVVRRTSVNEAEYALLERIVAGDRIVEAIENLSSRFEQIEPESIHDWFQRWGAAEYFLRIQRD